LLHLFSCSVGKKRCATPKKTFDLEITNMHTELVPHQQQIFPSVQWPSAAEPASYTKTRTARLPNEIRLRCISKRQANPTWGKEYVPSILAVRGEAPSASHALTITPQKLDSRDVHLLSLAECSAALLGLYHPDSVGLQEQRAFTRGGSPHPLHNFKLASPVGLRPLKGIVDVADRLGYLEALPKVRIKDSAAFNGYRWVVFPFIGDLLWAMQAKDGRHYCLNWSVKDSEDAFKRPLESKRFITPKGKLAEGVLVRHELESSYYLDAGIRTVFLAADAIDQHVRSNLRHLFLHHSRKVFLPLAEQQELVERFRICLESGVPALELITKLTGAGKYSREDCLNVLYQAIWYRRLRVDLFQPILINRTLNPESRDVLQVYADRFEEVAPC
jgi:hypothetical protein